MNGKVYSYVVADLDNIRIKRNYLSTSKYYKPGDLVYYKEEDKLYKVLSLNFTKEV